MIFATIILFAYILAFPLLFGENVMKKEQTIIIKKEATTIIVGIMLIFYITASISFGKWIILYTIALYFCFYACFKYSRIRAFNEEFYSYSGNRRKLPKRALVSFIVGISFLIAYLYLNF